MSKKQELFCLTYLEFLPAQNIPDVLSTSGEEKKFFLQKTPSPFMERVSSEVMSARGEANGYSATTSAVGSGVGLGVASLVAGAGLPA